MGWGPLLFCPFITDHYSWLLLLGFNYLILFSLIMIFSDLLFGFIINDYHIPAYNYHDYHYYHGYLLITTFY